MDKNIRIRKGSDMSDSDYTYGKDRSNLFGWQEDSLRKFLDKKLDGKKTATLNISTDNKPGTMEVIMSEDRDDESRFKVTTPRALRGTNFCKEGIQKYFGKAVAQQKRLKLYVKL